jgi:hypothetical protein
MKIQLFQPMQRLTEREKIVRPGGIGEADFVTDALSNRFRETEYMLNLKADYALGNGKWRIMSGYEIQHLSYKTFEGEEAEAQLLEKKLLHQMDFHSYKEILVKENFRPKWWLDFNFANSFDI